MVEVLLQMAYKTIIIVLILFCCEVSESKIIQGTLRSEQDWEFLTRFCFLSNHGMFEYEIEYPKKYKTQNILLYHDEKHQWPAVYKKNKTCQEKESVLVIPNGQVIFLNESFLSSGCNKSFEKGREGWLHCQSRRIFQSRRERWWFIAISNCDSKKGLYLRYRITMTNDEHNLWFKHFSADELYILQVDVCFLVLYVILVFMCLIEAQALRARHLLHRTYLLYFFSVIFECFGLIFLCAYYSEYAQNGTAGVGLKLLGKSVEAISTLLLLTLLLFIAKGYTVTRGRLPPRTKCRLCGFLSAYIVGYVGLYFIQQQLFDPGEVLYIYESSAGFAILGMRLVGWIWFVYAVIFTMIHYPEKSNFYTKIFLLYSLWFLSAPVVILISTFIVPKWVREKLINTVELFISIIAHLIFFVLTRPTKANKNFPYHVRTSQIGIMRESNGTPFGDYSIDKFAHHPYEVTQRTSNYPAVLSPPPPGIQTEMIGFRHQNNGTSPLGDYPNKFAHHPHEVTQGNNIHPAVLSSSLPPGILTEMAAYSNTGHTAVQNGHSAILPS